MSNAASLQIDPSSFVLHLGLTEKATLKTAGAVTYPEGLILARDTTDSKLVPYVSGGANGTGTPAFVLLKEIVATGAADFQIWAMTKGAVKLDKALVWNGGTPIGTTAPERDVLRSFDIDVKPVEDLNFYDNTIP